MADISQEITEYTGTVPQKNTMSNSAFMDAADAWAEFFTAAPAEFNSFKDQANSLRADVNAARSVCLAGADFRGEWSGLTGSVPMGASVYHDTGTIKWWIATVAIADVTTKTPGVASEWRPWTVPTDKGVVPLAYYTTNDIPAIEISSSVLTSLFSEYFIEIDNFSPVTSLQELSMQMSTDNGSSYISNADAYKWVVNNCILQSSGTGAASAYGDWEDSMISLSGGETVANDYAGISGSIVLRCPRNSVVHTRVFYEMEFYNYAQGAFRTMRGWGIRAASEDNNAIRIAFPGNIQWGDCRVYGVTKP